MQDENEIEIGSPNDPDNPQRALSQLQGRQVPSNIRGKLIYIPYERTKFLCPYHRVKTTVNMSDNPMRDKGNKMVEYECSCGVTYIRTQDSRKISPEWNR